ncbi:hypothetical protein LJR044_002478 [Microbacterium foliorum]
MDGYLPVKVNVPLADYRRLNAEAVAQGIDVADRIAQIVKLEPTPSPVPITRRRGPGTGRPSAYTSRAGEEIATDRRFGKSWNEIGRGLGIDGHTAKNWHTKYMNEVREQNTRDRAERKAS